jgi:hypothetical protein
MKKSIFITFCLVLFAFGSKSQNAEVLYFKANLSCCQARACGALENQVKEIIEAKYNNDKVIFKAVRLNDPDSEELINKYNAKSQTVIVKSIKKDKDFDATELVKTFSRTKDQESFEKDLFEQINKLL